MRARGPAGVRLERIDEAQPEGAWATLARGLRLAPQFRKGLGVTLGLALVTTTGRVIVPVTVQQVIDRGLRAGSGEPDFALVLRLVLMALAAVAVTATAGVATNLRLNRATERALSALRVRAFRHIHDLSLLHHQREHRGALVSRVTADIDAISRFMQWGGAVLVSSICQLAVALGVMTFYSWQLALLVVAVFAPLGLLLRWLQKRLGTAYDLVRLRVGELFSAIGETVVGAPVIRAYGIEERSNRRVARAVGREFDATYGATKTGAVMFSSGEVFAGLANAAVVVAGVLLGVGGQLSMGRLIAFLFLVALFVGPVQILTEVLDQAQTAIAGWRRVLNVLDVAPDVADPGVGGLPVPAGPIAVRFDQVEFAYPARGKERPETVLHNLCLDLPARSRIAVVGETGSGKTTFAKLLTRLMDPARGRILLSGVPLERLRFDSLRQRVVMVPQDGFLFDDTVAANVAQGRSGATPDEVRAAFDRLGLADWIDGLPQGLATHVGERGESLSVGERQLVALARAYIADPDLLVLDEATSAVDPATEVRLQRALDELTRGRTAVTIAHRLATAEAADEVLVFDRGRLVQRGPHERLVDAPGVYARLHATWSQNLDAQNLDARIT